MTYDSYEDWYDNGPGSEAFKRKLDNIWPIKNFVFCLFEKWSEETTKPKIETTKPKIELPEELFDI